MMKPKRIIILRHGESDANVKKILFATKPNHLMALTERGVQQCMACGDRLNSILNDQNISLWTSPYQRCRETAKWVLGQAKNANVTYHEDPRLREQDWGNFFSRDDAFVEARKRKQYSPFFYRIKAGESGADVYDRISTFLETLYRDFAKDNKTDVALLCTHGATALIFLMRFFKWPYEAFETTPHFKHCDYVILKLDEDTDRYFLDVDTR